MTDLFDNSTPSILPENLSLENERPLRPRSLAEQMRPREFEDVLGQDHLTKPDSPFRRRIATDKIGAIVLHGPPGTSKTTIGQIVGRKTGRKFRMLNGTNSSAADLRLIVNEAKVTKVLIFVDEIHRLRIERQEEFLSVTEDGTIQMIAATTGNPFHDIAPGLASRASIYHVNPLDTDAQCKLYEKARATVLANENVDVIADHETILDFVRRAGGDARRLVTAYESLTVGRPSGTKLHLNAELIAETYDGEPVHYDKGGDQHYDIVSAFIKSMRGSDPDATLFWLAKMIQAGEPPEFIARRIMVHASEDVGLADNTCLQTAVAALQAVKHIGYPEARITLAHAALHVALSPKSNSAYRGINLASDLSKTRPDITVPPYLKDAHYAGAKKLGHVGYLFPHNDPRGWVEQDYLPGIPAKTLYQSDGRGDATFESRADAYWHRTKAE